MSLIHPPTFVLQAAPSISSVTVYLATWPRGLPPLTVARFCLNFTMPENDRIFPTYDFAASLLFFHECLPGPQKWVGCVWSHACIKWRDNKEWTFISKRLTFDCETGCTVDCTRRRLAPTSCGILEFRPLRRAVRTC